MFNHAVCTQQLITHPSHWNLSKCYIALLINLRGKSQNFGTLNRMSHRDHFLLSSRISALNPVLIIVSCFLNTRHVFPPFHQKINVKSYIGSKFVFPPPSFFHEFVWIRYEVKLLFFLHESRSFFWSQNFICCLIN